VVRPVVAAVEVWWSSLLAADRGLLDLLDATERARAQSLRRSADQGRSLVGAALLRVVAGKRLGVPAGEVVVDRTCTDCGRPHGRPRVLGPGKAEHHVSVSHSGLLVVVALVGDGPVGIDVQRVADLGEGPGSEGEHGPWEWVRQEATLKVGGGMVRPAVRALRAPLDGYAAALATLTDRPPTDAGLVIEHWPESHLARWREDDARPRRHEPGDPGSRVV
jgi:4'-phosphopantetheinyl transferase